MADQDDSSSGEASPNEQSTAPTEPVEPEAIKPDASGGGATPPPGNVKAGDGPAEREPPNDDGGITNQAFVDRIKKSDRWIIGLTAALVGASLLQWCELHASGVDTSHLAAATQNLVSAESSAAAAEASAASAAESEAASMSSMRDIQSGQLAELNSSVTAAQNAADAARVSADAAQKQVGVMQADLRPWVRIVPSFPDTMRFPRPDWSYLPVRLTVENVGRSPAFNVQVRAFPYFPSAQEPDPVAYEKRMCDPLRHQPLLMPGYGVTLFPGDKNDNPEGSHLLSTVGLQPFDKVSHVTEDDGKKVFRLSAMGCADYTFGSPAAHHQTGFYVILARRIHRQGMPDAMTYSFNVGEEVAPEDIIVEQPQANSMNTD